MDYIGIPFKDHGRTRDGADCWGLVRIWQKEQRGIDLPSYDDQYESVKKYNQLCATVEYEAENWTPVTPGDEKLGDVIVIRMRGIPVHVGIVLGGGKFLHVYEGIDSVIESYVSTRWIDKITGFYRHG